MNGENLLEQLDEAITKRKEAEAERDGLRPIVDALRYVREQAMAGVEVEDEMLRHGAMANAAARMADVWDLLDEYDKAADGGSEP